MDTFSQSPVQITKDEFRKIGHQLVDTLAGFLDTIHTKPVTTGEAPGEIQKIISSFSFQKEGVPTAELFSTITEILLNHSLFNGHPKFSGYITGSPAPAGILAELLAAAVNPNVGANILSPVATEIEKQTVKWLAQFIGVDSSYGGILVSGGNMANFIAFLAARTAKAPKGIKENGLMSCEKEMMVYCSKATHIWIEKAAALFGHGLKSIRWISTDTENRMVNTELEKTINKDLISGKQPFMVIGTAGDVSTGTVDNLAEISEICKSYNLWFHVDGAYGIPAAIVPECQSLFNGIGDADSIALDPHKWLYAPLEAGCTLIKNPVHLSDTFSSHPAYYNFSVSGDEPPMNFYEYGFQNSRGFRALKVWILLQLVGRNGYIQLIRKDIAMSKLLFEEARNHPELESVSNHLSITTMRYVPEDFSVADKLHGKYLNLLNEKLLNTLQKGGAVFVSNAIVNDKYCLRSCFVNFRTTESDVHEIITTIVMEGRRVHKQLQEKVGDRIAKN